MNAIRLLLILPMFLLSQVIAEDAPAVIQDEDGIPVVYMGGTPDGMKTLAEHRVIVRYLGPSFRLCRCEGSGCPRRCQSSGEFAKFEVVTYLSYQKFEEGRGDGKQHQFEIAISDVDGFELGERALNEMIAHLHIGDLLVLEQKHLYGETANGALAHLRPIPLLKKITAKQANTLAEEANQHTK